MTGMPEGPFLHGQSTLESQIKGEQWQQTSDQEAAIGRDAKAKMDSLQRAINLAQRVVVLKHSPGFEPFVQAVEDLRKHAENEMIGCQAGNEQLRILQGRCQAFGSILALMRRTEQNMQTLATQLEAAKQKAAAMIRPDGRVVQEPIGGI